MSDTEKESVAGSTRFMLDKRIPLASLVAWIITFGGFIWYASQQDLRVQTIGSELAAAKGQIETLQTKTGDLALVNFRLTAVEGTANRIEQKVDALAKAR